MAWGNDRLSSRSGRIALGLTLVAAGLLAALMVLGALRYRDAPRSSAAGGPSALERALRRHQLIQGERPARASAAPSAQPQAPAHAPSPVSRMAEETAAPAAARKPAPVPARSTFKLTAARGDCWAEVRQGSEEGDVLYTGIISSGDSRTFRSKRLWIRLGAPETIDATIDGNAAAIPADTLDLVVTRRGFRAATRSATA